MQFSSDHKCGLFVTDIDNTLFDWVSYYVPSMETLIAKVSQIIGVDESQLMAEAQQVFSTHRSIEHPFVVQEMPSVIAHYGDQIDRMLSECVEPARQAFLEVGRQKLVAYDGVKETLAWIRSQHRRTPVVALTDAPRYVAMWKLNKLGLLSCFDAVYGLADPRLPTANGRVKVDPKILLKHLQQENFKYEGRIRILPEEYEKPGTRGLKTVLMDADIDENAEAKSRTWWIGDNLRKDVGLGKRMGVMTVWAEYGTRVPPDLLVRLKRFSPSDNVHKNVSLDIASEATPQPDLRLNAFADLRVHL